MNEKEVGWEGRAERKDVDGGLEKKGENRNEKQMEEEKVEEED